MRLWSSIRKRIDNHNLQLTMNLIFNTAKRLEDDFYKFLAKIASPFLPSRISQTRFHPLLLLRFIDASFPLKLSFFPFLLLASGEHSQKGRFSFFDRIDRCTQWSNRCRSFFFSFVLAWCWWFVIINVI